MKKLALIAVSYVALGSAGAWAGPGSACTLSNLTSGSPSGSFETKGTGGTGTLDGYFTGTYVECTSYPGGTIIAAKTSNTFTNAVIPFFVSTSEGADVTISVATSKDAGATFDLYLNGNPPTALETDVASGVDTPVTIPAGLNALAITENYTAGVHGNSLSVGVSLVNLITPVPEPATLALLAFGAACLTGLRRRRRPA